MRRQGRSRARRHLRQAEGAAGDRRQDRAKAASTSPPTTSRARATQGATDLEIHDTVLIAAVFCMCNRYVDGLATWVPDDPDFYRQRAAIVADHGYAAATLAAASAAGEGMTVSESLIAGADRAALLGRRARRSPRTRPAPSKARHRQDGERRRRRASVTAKNLDTGLTREAVAGADGFYRLLLLPVGPYSRHGRARRSSRRWCRSRSRSTSARRCASTRSSTLPLGHRDRHRRGRRAAGRHIQQRARTRSSPAASSSTCRSTAATSPSSGCCRPAWRRSPPASPRPAAACARGRPTPSTACGPSRTCTWSTARRT